MIVEASNELNLQSRSDRFELFFLLINLARVIKTIVDRIPSKPIEKYRKIPRDNGCTIEITDDAVLKRISVSMLVLDERFEFLKGFYTSLIQNSVKCVPTCKDIRRCSTTVDNNQFIELLITPHGFQIMPQKLDQLLIALK